MVDRLVKAGDIVLLTGVEKDSLKTWLALQLALARIVDNERWLGLSVKRSTTRRVLFISTETRKVPLTARFKALCAGAKVDANNACQGLMVIDEPVTMVPISDRNRAETKARNTATLASLKVPRNSKDEGEHARIAALKNAAEHLAEQALDDLGDTLRVLDAIAAPDKWSLIVIDTLRECLAGDENSFADTRRFMQAARALARHCNCVVLIIHHSNKTGAHGESRSARGSGQITAAPDIIITIDASGEYPTAHFKLRNHEPIDPIGYKLVTSDGKATIETLAPCAGKSKDGITEDEVMKVFREHPNDGLTVNRIRVAISAARGGQTGSKVAPRPVQKHLDSLIARKLISECEIGKAAKGGNTHARIPPRSRGRAGSETPLSKPRNARQRGRGGGLDLFGDPTDV